MKVTIIIPNYNGCHFMEPCLASLKKQTFKDYGILVVDNASTDGSVEFVKENYPEIEVIALKENYGFSKAVNIGIRRSRTPYVILLNNDTTADPHYLEEMVKAIEQSPRIFSVSSKMIQMYHPELIETLYLETQAYQIDDSSVVEMLKAELARRSVLILAPGATIRTNKEAVRQYVESQDIYTVAINFCPTNITPNLLFLSNRKRLNTLLDRLHCIPAVMATSNLINELPGNVRFVNYISYLGEGRAADNAGAMLVRVLKKAGAARILLAGFDGFDVDPTSNYCVDSYRNVVERRTAEAKNQEIAQQLKLALNGILYEFITPTRYQLT